MSVLSTLRHAFNPTYKEGHCWFNAAKNLRPLSKTNGVPLHWVCGARQYHANAERCMWTGMDGRLLPDGRKVEVVHDEKTLRRRWRDTHAWLEDDSGNVYDYIYETDAQFPAEWKNTSRWKMDVGFVNGIHRSRLAELGFQLTPFSLEGQRVVLANLMEWCDDEGFDTEFLLLSQLKV